MLRLRNLPGQVFCNEKHNDRNSMLLRDSETGLLYISKGMKCLLCQGYQRIFTTLRSRLVEVVKSSKTGFLHWRIEGRQNGLIDNFKVVRWSSKIHLLHQEIVGNTPSKISILHTRTQSLVLMFGSVIKMLKCPFDERYPRGFLDNFRLRCDPVTISRIL